MLLLCDDTSERLKKLLVDEGDLRQEAAHVISTIRNGAFPEPAREMHIDSTAAAPLLRNYTEALERHMSVALAGHSRYYWSHLARRIGPAKRPGQDETVAMLNYLTFQLACLKFGADTTDAEEWRPAGAFIAPHPGLSEALGQRDLAPHEGFTPAEIGPSEHSGVMLTLRLAAELVDAYANLRSVGKGARILVERGGQIRLVMSPELSALLDLYDRRRFSPSTSLFAGAGLHVDTEVDTEAVRNGRAILLPWPNVSGLSWDLMVPGDGERGWEAAWRFVPNFVPVGLGLAEFAATAGLFDDQLTNQLGITARELADVLEAFNRRMLILIDDNFLLRYQLFQRGWWLLERSDHVVEDIARFYRDVADLAGLDLPAATDAVRRVFACLRGYHCDDIQLSRPGPFPILREGRGAAVLELWFTPWVLNHMLASLPWSVMGAEANRRGRVFEAKTKSILASEGIQLWECGRRLRRDDGLERELDVSVVEGDTLFLIECKSAIVPPDPDTGDRSAVHHRIADVVDRKLSQCDRLRDFLRTERRGLNYEIPGGVRRLVSVACGPYPEFLPARNDYYFLGDGSPRYLTPAELVRMIRGFRPADHLGRKYCTVLA